MLLNQIFKFKNSQCRQHPSGRELRLLDQIIHQHRFFSRENPQQGNLVIGQTCISVGKTQRRRNLLGFLLLPGLIPQRLRFFPCLGFPQFLREAGLIFPQDVPCVRYQTRTVPNQPVEPKTLASIRQMSGQVSRGSAGEYQTDERAGVARLNWRVSGR